MSIYFVKLLAHAVNANLVRLSSDFDYERRIGLRINRVGVRQLGGVFEIPLNRLTQKAVMISECKKGNDGVIGSQLVYWACAQGPHHAIYDRLIVCAKKLAYDGPSGEGGFHESGTRVRCFRDCKDRFTPRSFRPYLRICHGSEGAWRCR